MGEGTERTDEEKQAAYNARQEIAKREAFLSVVKLLESQLFTNTQAGSIAEAFERYYDIRQDAAWETED